LFKALRKQAPLIKFMRQQLQRTYASPLSRLSRHRHRRRLKPSSGIKITSVRGFFTALLFLGVPTVSLGTLCVTLLQSNLKLSQTNDELNAIASEVKAEVDSLDAEINSLRERAGVPAATAQAPKGTAKGGPENNIDALALLEDAQQQVPQLNQALNSAVKPALEAALAEEAAYPDAQPVLGEAKVSSEFGIRSNPFGGNAYEVHEGMDFVGAQGDIIAATGDGVVVLAGNNGGYGTSVTIDHGHGYKTLYAHMSQKRVNAGDRVKSGQIIGYIGSTGRSSGPHLHYSLYKNDKPINPRTLLKLAESTPEKAAR
jgi:murein DD-endopeptidase MepM/ murein hydrolase activator NlpD